jgi:hypothetical protein
LNAGVAVANSNALHVSGQDRIIKIDITMNESARVEFDGDMIRYRSAVYGDWDLPLSDVRVIGEATNQSGPMADDYFLCFATGPSMWHEASFYADGRNEFLRALGAALDSPFELGLCHSTDFASRVLWPPSLVGEPMFRFDDIPPNGLVERFFGTPQNRQTYSDQVTAVLSGDG